MLQARKIFFLFWPAVCSSELLQSRQGHPQITVFLQGCSVADASQTFFIVRNLTPSSFSAVLLFCPCQNEVVSCSQQWTIWWSHHQSHWVHTKQEDTSHCANGLPLACHGMVSRCVTLRQSHGRRSRTAISQTTARDVRIHWKHKHWPWQMWQFWL